jgi:aconitase A
MTEIPKERQPFWQQLFDLLLRFDVSTDIAIEVTDEIIKQSTMETPIETIRSMILDSLRKRNEKAAAKLSDRFEQLKIILDEARGSEIGPAGEIYDETASDELLKSDEITAAEFYFMMGREGRSWQRKKKHYDTTSTETSSEEYYDD